MVKWRVVVGWILGLGLLSFVVGARLRSSTEGTLPVSVSSTVAPVVAPSTTLPPPVTVTVTVTNEATPTTSGKAPTVATNPLPRLAVRRLPVFRGSAPLGGGPIVVPLSWSGEPIDAKVIAVSPISPSFVVVDLAEGVVRVYPPGDHYMRGYSVDSAVLTARGDALVVLGRVDGNEVYLIPDADFSRPSTRLNPSSIETSPSGILPEIYALADQSGSRVWVLQRTDHEDEYDAGETLVDLVSVDTAETVMATELDGRYVIGGIIDDGLVLIGYRKTPVDILVLGEDGTLRNIPVGITDDFVSQYEGFQMVEAHGRYIALLGRDLQEIVVVDIETNIARPIPKPGVGLWTPNGIPRAPERPNRMTRTDEFVIGFRPTAGKWSLQAISLGNQSVRELGEYPDRQPTSSHTYRKPVFWAETVAGGETVLAFTGSDIYVVDEAGNLLPLVGLPADEYVVSDAA